MLYVHGLALSFVFWLFMLFEYCDWLFALGRWVYCILWRVLVGSWCIRKCGVTDS